MLYFRGPSQFFKGPDFPFSLMGPIMLLLSPQNLRALQVLILRARLILTPASITVPYYTVSALLNYSKQKQVFLLGVAPLLTTLEYYPQRYSNSSCVANMVTREAVLILLGASAITV